MDLTIKTLVILAPLAVAFCGFFIMFGKLKGAAMMKQDCRAIQQNCQHIQQEQHEQVSRDIGDIKKSIGRVEGLLESLRGSNVFS